MLAEKRNMRNYAGFRCCASAGFAVLTLVSCDGAHSKSAPAGPATPKSAPVGLAAPLREGHQPSARPLAAPAPFSPTKVDVEEVAMDTSVRFVAYTTEAVDEPATRSAIAQAVAEIRRLEGVLSEWKRETEIGQVNARAGEWVSIGSEAMEVIERGLWAGKLSEGRFDITFQAMSKVWKFGSAQENPPQVPTRAEVDRLRKRVDYRRVELDVPGRRVRIGKDQQLGLGGIAKGYIVDRAARILRAAGVRSFLAQAGGDLYGSGSKPDGKPWVSGIRDPRGPEGEYFAVLELTDHAFSTAGDYARQYVVGGKRYHHIIDPTTGYPATASRSVTVWAPDATTADAVDDAVFILGPERGLKLVESLEGVGAVIVDARNRVFISERVKDRVKVLKHPTDGT
jgi:thiamine biosynthesis lipoprotein